VYSCAFVQKQGSKADYEITIQLQHSTTKISDEITIQLQHSIAEIGYEITIQLQHSTGTSAMKSAMKSPENQYRPVTWVVGHGSWVMGLNNF
jgi:hypothetical protein